jgi:TM2 domain-containing membrane protein YozV
MTRTTTLDPGTAAFLTFLIPGWGQMRRGKVKAGLIWLVVVIAGYFAFVIPGLILHGLCILDAYYRE